MQDSIVKKIIASSSEFDKKCLTLKGHTAPVASICFSPDGKIIVSCSDDKSIIFWDR